MHSDSSRLELRHSQPSLWWGQAARNSLVLAGPDHRALGLLGPRFQAEPPSIFPGPLPDSAPLPPTLGSSEYIGAVGTGHGIPTPLQLQAGREPVAWLAEAAVQRGAEGAAGQLGEDDCRASEPQGTWARLQGQLAAVAAPRAVGCRHYGLTVGCDCRHRSVEDLVSEVPL